MGFQKGNPGKQKGTTWKKTLLLEEKAQKLKCDPFEILLRFANGDWKGLGYDAECYFIEKPDGQVKAGYTISPEMRLTAAKEAVKYLHAQKRAVDVTMDASVGVTKEKVAEAWQELKELQQIE